MRRRRKSAATTPRTDVDAALAAMGADELREVVREMLLELDDRAHGRVTTVLISRAVRGGSGWTPAAPSAAGVAEVVALADAAARVGYADPADVDERYDEIVDVLKDETFWAYERWAVQALGAMGKKAEAIRLAESSRGPWTSDADVDALCEEMLLSSGLVEEAYALFALSYRRHEVASGL